MPKPNAIKGPDGYELWKVSNSSPLSNQWAEYLLYSDSHIAGSIMEGLGPFQVFSALPDSRGMGYSAPALCLRVLHPDVEWDDRYDWEETDDSSYHGGAYTDELAGLLSLILGVRLKAGPESRRCFGDDDLKGKPSNYDEWRKPQLSPKFGRNPTMPNVYKTSTTLVHSTEYIDLLMKYPTIQPEAAVRVSAN